MVIVVGNGHGDLDEAVYISHNVNTLGKGIQLVSIQLWINSRACWVL